MADPRPAAEGSAVLPCGRPPSWSSPDQIASLGAISSVPCWFAQFSVRSREGRLEPFLDTSCDRLLTALRPSLVVTREGLLTSRPSRRNPHSQAENGRVRPGPELERTPASAGRQATQSSDFGVPCGLRRGVETGRASRGDEWPGRVGAETESTRVAGELPT
jgi:hypothetical protein